MKEEDFYRYEFKYLLDSHNRSLIEEEISHFMQSDTHVNQNNSYFVRSLYFDDDICSNFYKKVDGMRDRYKFRIRTYIKEFDGVTPIFFEKKGRIINRTYKHRVEIEQIDIEYFLKAISMNSFQKIKNKYNNIDIVDLYLADIFRKQIKPRVIIDYRRVPYVSSFDTNFRITFDDQLMSHVYNGYFFDKDSQSNLSKSMKNGYSILEIKFFRRIPIWFHRIIQAYDLRREPISKYALAIQTNQLGYDTGE